MKLNIPTSLILLTAVSSGAFFYPDLGTVETTPGSGVYEFIDPTTTGWSGNGTLSGPTGAGDGTTLGNLVAIDDFTGNGTLSMGAVEGWGTSVYLGTTAQMVISLTGTGSADLEFYHRSSGAPLGHPLNFNIKGITGDISEIMVEFTFSRPIAPTDAASTSNSPFLAAFRPSRDTLFDAEYLGVIHTNDGSNFTAGASSQFEAVDITGNLNTVNGSGWQWDDDSLSVTGKTSRRSNWNGINSFDIDNDGAYEDGTTNGVIEDTEAIYATGVRFTFLAGDGNNFQADDAFTFSTNGTIYDDTIDSAVSASIPEPSGWVLSALAVLGISFRRQRS